MLKDQQVLSWELLEGRSRKDEGGLRTSSPRFRTDLNDSMCGFSDHSSLHPTEQLSAVLTMEEPGMSYPLPIWVAPEAHCKGGKLHRGSSARMRIAQAGTGKHLIPMCKLVSHLSPKKSTCWKSWLKGCYTWAGLSDKRATGHSINSCMRFGMDGLGIFIQTRSPR
jgi:hypothetical protein